MKYFTAAEAKAIIRHGSIHLCTGCPNNPNLEAATVLMEYVDHPYHKKNPVTVACVAFELGRATGIREERARRKKAP